MNIHPHAQCTSTNPLKDLPAQAQFLMKNSRTGKMTPHDHWLSYSQRFKSPRLKEAQQVLQHRKEIAQSANSSYKVKTSKGHLNEDLIEELVKPYLYLEGQCFVDPRNQRLYERAPITYDENLQVVSAFRKNTDDEPPDLNDHQMILVEGPHGLAQLVQEFTQNGGNRGDITTPWPCLSSGMMCKATLTNVGSA